MSTRFIRPICIAALATLAGCSAGSPPGTSTPPKGATASAAPADAAASESATIEAKATKEMQLYDQMRIKESFDLAVPLGEEIVAKYPNTAAAAKVKETLADVRAKAAALAESQPLARQWSYTAVLKKGGTQYAASIENTPPLTPSTVTGKDARRVHLIVRQHPQWGQNVYLILDNDKFDCRSGCPTLPVAFDHETAKPMKTTIPPTGEPALFIDDDKNFIARMLRTKRVAIDVALSAGGKKTLVFETGGLDISHLPGAGKKK